MTTTCGDAGSVARQRPRREELQVDDVRDHFRGHAMTREHLAQESRRHRDDSGPAQRHPDEARRPREESLGFAAAIVDDDRPCRASRRSTTPARRTGATPIPNSPSGERHRSARRPTRATRRRARAGRSRARRADPRSMAANTACCVRTISTANPSPRRSSASCRV